MKDKLMELIGIIADWELPETGETWPSGNPVSYEANVGSLGVRDYMRSIATKALTILDAEGVAVPIGYADPRSIQGYTLGQYGDFRVSDQSKLRSVPLYDHTHPARSGVVSDAADSGRVDGMEDLLADWRRAADAHDEIGFGAAADVGRTCADDLESALAAQGQGAADELFNTFRLAYYGANKSLAPELESFRRAYKAIAPPASPAGVPDGWMLVPCELPERIRTVLVDRFARAVDGEVMFFTDIWSDLIAAAPSAPEGGEVGL